MTCIKTNVTCFVQQANYFCGKMSITFIIKVHKDRIRLICLIPLGMLRSTSLIVYVVEQYVDTDCKVEE